MAGFTPRNYGPTIWMTRVQAAVDTDIIAQLREERMPEHDFITTGLPTEREATPIVDPIYCRQSTLGLSIPTVILVGAGGVGCWVALSLVLGGVSQLAIFDGDTLSDHNLNRFPLPESQVGQLKSAALASWLRTLRPKAEIVARGEFDPSLHNIEHDWLVCATDSLKSRRMCHAYCNPTWPANNKYQHQMKYLEVGADGERWTLSPAPPEFSTDNEDTPGYQTVPVHVGPCMMAGAAAAYYVLHDCIPTGTHGMSWDSAVGILTGSWMSEVEAWDDSKGETTEFVDVDDSVIPEVEEVDDGQGEQA